MNYITRANGKQVEVQTPLPVTNIGAASNKESITGETVTFITGAAGFTGKVSLDKKPILNLTGDKVGSFWRQPKNIIDNGKGKLVSLTETDGSADIVIFTATYNLEQLFETPAVPYRAIIEVMDTSGKSLRGYIGGVAASSDSYTFTIYNTSGGTTQNWIGSLTDFTNTALASYKIYSNETSISWTTGTILTDEVVYDEGVDEMEYFDSLTNGDYGVDYERGVIYYKKDTTGTSDTIAYTIGRGGHNYIKTISATFTRPSNTTTYTANDAVNNSTSAPVIMTFSNCAAGKGGGGIIKDVRMVDSANQSTVGIFELWLFTATITMDNDNAAFTPTDAEVATARVIPLNISYAGDDTAGAGGNRLYQTDAADRHFVCASTVADLYGTLKVKNAYPPVDAEIFTVYL